MSHAQIRPAALGDLSRMLEIEIAAATLFPTSVLPESVGRTGSPRELSNAIASNLAWVAELALQGVVGFLAAQVRASSLHIVEMDVHPSHGRQGIGGMLLQHAVQHCKTIGLNHLTLSTFSTVPWNAPFYSKHGFRICSKTQDFPHLAQAIAHETMRGLENRVAMVRDVA